MFYILYVVTVNYFREAQLAILTKTKQLSYVSLVLVRRLKARRKTCVEASTKEMLEKLLRRHEQKCKYTCIIHTFTYIHIHQHTSTPTTTTTTHYALDTHCIQPGSQAARQHYLATS